MAGFVMQHIHTRNLNRGQYRLNIKRSTSRSKAAQHKVSAIPRQSKFQSWALTEYEEIYARSLVELQVAGREAVTGLIVGHQEAWTARRVAIFVFGLVLRVSRGFREAAAEFAYA